MSSTQPIDENADEGLLGPQLDSTLQLIPGTVVRLKPDSRQSEYLDHVGRVRSLQPGGKVKVALHGALWKLDRIAQRREHLVSMLSSEVQLLARPAPDVMIKGAFNSRIIIRLMGEQGWGLLNGIAEIIAECLLVGNVNIDKVCVDGSSSTRGDFPLSEVLTCNQSTWWISAAGSMPGGVGREWIEFSFGSFCSIKYIGIKIPPLPQGPLSVREFCVMRRRIDPFGRTLADDCETAWELVSPQIWQTLNTPDVQEFAFEHSIQAERLRLVCTKTAAAGYLARMGGVDCIGLFQVCFA